MPTFLVRLIDNHDLVGIFVARNMGQLAVLVDEYSEPDDCEFIIMPPGGVMWTDRAIPVPIELPEEDDPTEPDPIPWAASTLTDSWWDSFYGFSEDNWQPLFPDRPSKPPCIIRHAG